MSRINAFNGGFGGFGALVSGDNPREYNGAVMLFAQTAAPTGWTKDTTYNDYALRITSGTVSTGGSDNFSTVFASRPVAGAFPGGAMISGVEGTTLDYTHLPSHTHTSYSIFTESSPTVPFVSGQRAVPPGGQWGIIVRPSPNPGGADSPAGTDISTPLGPTKDLSDFPGGAGSHSHTITNSPGGTFTGTNLNMAVKYLDMIIASYPA